MQGTSTYLLAVAWQRGPALGVEGKAREVLHFGVICAWEQVTGALAHIAALHPPGPTTDTHHPGSPTALRSPEQGGK